MACLPIERPSDHFCRLGVLRGADVRIALRRRGPCVSESFLCRPQAQRLGGKRPDQVTQRVLMRPETVLCARTTPAMGPALGMEGATVGSGKKQGPRLLEASMQDPCIDEYCGFRIDRHEAALPGLGGPNAQHPFAIDVLDPDCFIEHERVRLYVVEGQCPDLSASCSCHGSNALERREL